MSRPSTSKFKVPPSTLAASSSKRSEDGDRDDAHADAATVAGENRATSSLLSSPADENVFHSAITAPEETEEQDAAPYPEAAAAEPLPPPDFKPFFTVVEDGESSEHHHPTVHYIFSDDDSEDLTSATLAAIDAESASGSRAELEERVMLLDIDVSGKQVAVASSLSPRWQALKVDIEQAPSWGGAAQGGGDGGLMLKVSGKEITKSASKERRKRSSNVEDLLRTFGEQLASLDGIIGDDSSQEQAQ